MNRLTSVAALVLAACLTAFGQSGSADKKSLEEFDRAWGDAGQRGDRTFLMNVYADDYMGLSPAGMLTKAQTIDATVKQAEKDKGNPNAPKLKHDNYEISSTPNTATITHRNIITAMVDGKEKTTYSRSIHFLEKRNGKWQVVSSTGHALSDAEMLLYLEHEWNDADIKRDAAWFESNYADDATDVSSRTGLINTKADVVADMKAGKSTMEWAELSDLHARIDGSFGVVTGKNHVKGRDDKGVPFDRTASFTDTFVKRDGRWQIWATQGTQVKSEEEVAKAK